MKIFVLNLQYAHERRKFITKQLDKLGLDYEIQNCVIGKNLTQEELEKEVHMGYMAKSPNWFTPGAIGATLTGKIIYQKIIDGNLPYALVIEDDIILNKNLPEILNKIEPHIKDNEVILLYYNKVADKKNVKLSSIDTVKIDEKHKLYYPLTNHEATMGCAFIITQAAARGIIKVNTPIVVIGDSWDYYHTMGGLTQLRCVYPRIVIPADFKSTIEYTNLSFKSSFIPKILSFIDTYKVFPAYQILKYIRMKKRVKREKIIFVDSPSVFVSES